MQFGQQLVCTFSPVTSASAEEIITSWAWLSFLFLKECARGCGAGGISCLLLSLAKTTSILYIFSCSYVFWKLLKLFLTCSGFFSLPEFFFFFWNYTYSVPSLLLSVDIWFISLYWLGCNKNNQLLWNSSAWVWPRVSHSLMHRIDSSCYVYLQPWPLHLDSHGLSRGLTSWPLSHVKVSGLDLF